jgi:hypothetical protein
MSLEWAHAFAVILGALLGAGATIFYCGRWVGRVEERLKTNFRKAIEESEKKIEERVVLAQTSFDETLKGFRQKINDVELDTERRFLQKGEFDDFRKEYREDMRDLKAMIGERRAGRAN